MSNRLQCEEPCCAKKPTYKTILPWQVLVAIVFALLMVLYAKPAKAAPIAVMDKDGVKITVYDESCKIEGQVSNLPYRATWEEKGQVFEGCGAPTPFGVVVFYFSGDKTVATVPTRLFQKLTGA